MSIEHFDASSQKFILLRNLFKRLSFSPYHLFIIAWCALVPLFAKPALSSTPEHSQT